MDERRFDELTKALVAAKPSRRAALRRLAGGGLATVFGALARTAAAANDVGIEARTCGQRCDSDSQCNAGLRCGEASEECFAIPGSRHNCSGNGDCAKPYETCNNNGKCVNTVGDCEECRRNGDCKGAGAECNDGRCDVPQCVDNDDCGKNKKCRKGECVRRD